MGDEMAVLDESIPSMFWDSIDGLMTCLCESHPVPWSRGYVMASSKLAVFAIHRTHDLEAPIRWVGLSRFSRRVVCLVGSILRTVTLSIPPIHKPEPPTSHSHLMSHHRLRPLVVPVSLRLQRVENLAHLLLLFLRQLHIPRSEILFQTMGLGRSGDGDHALRHHPRQSHLRQSASLALGKSLDLLDDLLVVVEVLALEFGDCGMC
jgi:hypothetical protein